MGFGVSHLTFPLTLTRPGEIISTGSHDTQLKQLNNNKTQMATKL